IGRSLPLIRATRGRTNRSGSPARGSTPPVEPAATIGGFTARPSRRHLAPSAYPHWPVQTFRGLAVGAGRRYLPSAWNADASRSSEGADGAPRTRHRVAHRHRRSLGVLP